MNDFEKKNGIFVPQEYKAKKNREDRQRFLDSYNEQHKYCPKCYSDRLENRDINRDIVS